MTLWKILTRICGQCSHEFVDNFFTEMWTIPPRNRHLFRKYTKSIANPMLSPLPLPMQSIATATMPFCTFDTKGMERDKVIPTEPQPESHPD